MLWTPDQSPFPPGWLDAAHQKCHWFEDAVLGNVCLMSNDRISNDMRKNPAQWHSHCEELVTRWRDVDTPHVFLDVGANIGVCTLMMLARTNASVVAVEPSHANLFYLMSSLRARASEGPARVYVLPQGAGNTTARERMYRAAHNAGNSVVGMSSPLVRDHATQDMHESFDVDIAPLDDVPFLKGRRVPLVKMDVQGFECRALRGMRRLLSTTRALRVELADRWLRAQGCSAAEAIAVLHELNFSAVGPTRCAMSRYGCDVTFVRRHNVLDTRLRPTELGRQQLADDGK